MVEIKSLRKDYKNFSLDISMQIPEGKVVGFIGKNGAGKSTTIKSILGLIKPTSGNVEVFGVNSRNLSPREKERIGVALSDSMFSYYLTVEDIIAVMRAFYPTFDEDYFRQMCDRFKLPLNKQIKDFSTGMKAKVKVLSAISHQAELLILDEPTTGLDIEARTEILDTLKSYKEKNNCSILISSHISTDLQGLCDEIVLIADGKIVLHSTLDEINNSYAVVLIPEELFDEVPKDKILGYKSERFGYTCIINDKSFFEDNFSELKLKDSTIDDLIMLLGKEEE